MVKAHFILKQFSYEKGFTDPSSTIYYCKKANLYSMFWAKLTLQEEPSM
jgi:hypothetical protein